MVLEVCLEVVLEVPGGALLGMTEGDRKGRTARSL